MSVSPEFPPYCHRHANDINIDVYMHACMHLLLCNASLHAWLMCMHVVPQLRGLGLVLACMHRPACATLLSYI